MNRWLRLLPLVVLVLVVAGLVWRLSVPADRDVRSTMVGRPLPDARLGPVDDNRLPFQLRSLTGKPMIVNFFASWCVPCIAEASQLATLEQRGAPIVGIAVRDTPEAIRNFLAEHGNPYRSIGIDPQSAVQIDLGSSGVPESFVVDGQGIIRYQHIGPIEATDIPLLLAKLEQAR